MLIEEIAKGGETQNWYSLELFCSNTYMWAFDHPMDKLLL